MKWYVNRNGVKAEIYKVLETFNGDLYFFKKDSKDEQGYELVFARLYKFPDSAEWGENKEEFLRKHYGAGIWRVPKSNWSLINTYERGLLYQE